MEELEFDRERGEEWGRGEGGGGGRGGAETDKVEMHRETGRHTNAGKERRDNERQRPTPRAGQIGPGSESGQTTVSTESKM